MSQNWVVFNDANQGSRNVRAGARVNSIQQTHPHVEAGPINMYEAAQRDSGNYVYTVACMVLLYSKHYIMCL